MNLRDQLKTIRDQTGTLTPSNVVAAATPDNHPLHHRFEWDDTIAGPKYREIQAADLIRSVKITYRSSPAAEPHTVRAFHAVKTNTETEYVDIDDVATDDFARALVLRNAQIEWNTLKRKWQHLAEFMAIVAEDVKEA